MKLLGKDTIRIYERNKERELIKQKQLYEKRLDEISSLNMEILNAMIESKNTEEEIVQWTENHHRAAGAIYNVQIEEIENRIITLKREREKERSRWCWARRKKNSEEIRRRKKNARNAAGDEEERKEGERRKEERI